MNKALRRLPSLDFLKGFEAAGRLLSFTRAAEETYVTQSALSSRIAALEDELGVLLLDRRDKQFRLTTAGVRFARHAERLLNLQREIRSELGSAGAARSAALRVGVIESVLHSWLIEWVQTLRREQPMTARDHAPGLFRGVAIAANPNWGEQPFDCTPHR